MINKMRIARIRHLFYPEMPQDYFYELSARQAEQGHEVHVLTWNKSGEYSQNISGQGFIIHRLQGLNYGFFGAIHEYPFLLGLPSELESIKPDIVHGESHLFLPSLQALRQANYSNLPYVVTIHGVFASRSLAVNLAQKTYLHAISRVFKSADRIICLTESDAEEIVKFGFSPEKIRLVPNAVDTERFRPCNEQNDDLIIWIGRFVPEKGLEYLVEAAKTVVNMFGNVRFLLIGYGPLKTKIMKLASDSGMLGKSIFFGDTMSRDEIAKILCKASIFAFPSLKEGLPLSVLEAMACGLPVVGFDISGVRDLVRHDETGLLVPPRNSKLLAEAIKCLLNDKSLKRKFGRRARQIATEKYDWKTVLTALENVYREAIDESQSVIRTPLETKKTISFLIENSYDTAIQQLF